MSAPVETKSEKLEKSAVVALYETHAEAETAIRELQKSGLDMQKLSIIGKPREGLSNGGRCCWLLHDR